MTSRYLEALGVLALSVECGTAFSLGLQGELPANPHTPEQLAALEHDHITCPVLAMMVDGGFLHPDEHGSITMGDMNQGMIDTGADPYTAEFFSVGIIQYDTANKETQQHRDRCYPGTPCYALRREQDAAGLNRTAESERYLNIYTMNGVETVEHGFSTGIRGGWTNPPDYDDELHCDGIFPCVRQFDFFARTCASPDGRFYRENIHCMICKAQQEGDYSGEWSFNPLGKRRGWQMSVATLSMLAGYGRLPSPDADPYGPETHFTMEDMQRMFMDGKNPIGWEKRSWSNFTMIKDLTETSLPCEDKYGETLPWWNDSTCPTNTGVPCSPVFGEIYKQGCPAHSICVNSWCVCNRGANGISTCSNGAGQCVEREDKCTYFGEKCTRTLADNPAAPGWEPSF